MTVTGRFLEKYFGGKWYHFGHVALMQMICLYSFVGGFLLLYTLDSISVISLAICIFLSGVVAKLFGVVLEFYQKYKQPQTDIIDIQDLIWNWRGIRLFYGVMIVLLIITYIV